MTEADREQEIRKEIEREWEAQQGVDPDEPLQSQLSVPHVAFLLSLLDAARAEAKAAEELRQAQQDRADEACRARDRMEERAEKAESEWTRIRDGKWERLTQAESEIADLRKRLEKAQLDATLETECALGAQRKAEEAEAALAAAREAHEAERKRWEDAALADAGLATAVEKQLVADRDRARKELAEQREIAAKAVLLLAKAEDDRDHAQREAEKKDEALREAKDFIQSIYSFRLDAGEYQDGDKPFGVIDYYGMEDLIKKIEAALAASPAPAPCPECERLWKAARKVPHDRWLAEMRSRDWRYKDYVPSEIDGYAEPQAPLSAREGWMLLELAEALRLALAAAPEPGREE